MDDENVGRVPSSPKKLKRKEKLRTVPKLDSKRSREDLEKELALYQSQTAEFFEKERGLCSTGVLPWPASENPVLTEQDIDEVFGNRISNDELIHLYKKIYGTRDVTNDAIPRWMVKGYITESKGKEVNWAETAAAEARFRVDHIQRELTILDDGPQLAGKVPIQFNVSSSMIACTEPSALDEFSVGSEREVGRCVRALEEILNDNAESREAGAVEDGCAIAALCPYKISDRTMKLITEVSEVNAKRVNSCNERIKFLSDKLSRMLEKLTQLRFNRDDRRNAHREAQEKWECLEAEVCQRTEDLSSIAKKISAADGSHLLMAEALQEFSTLKAKKEEFERKLANSSIVLEEHKERALKGEEQYKDQEHGISKIESDLKNLHFEFTKSQQHKSAVTRQLENMEKGGGLSLWPKPALHPSPPADVVYTLDLTPCSVCNKWFTFFDVVFSSCKHPYHIFCLTEYCKASTRCAKCNQFFHPAWWTAFGFRELDQDLMNYVVTLKVDEEREALKKNILKEYEHDLPDDLPTWTPNDLGSLVFITPKT